MLVLSFCNLDFIKRHFLFLTTTMGRGFFNLFLASMFLVGDQSVWSWVMFGGFAAIGVLFIIIGCACVEGIDDGSRGRKPNEKTSGESNVNEADNAHLLQA